MYSFTDSEIIVLIHILTKILLDNTRQENPDDTIDEFLTKPLSVDLSLTVKEDNSDDEGIKRKRGRPKGSTKLKSLISEPFPISNS